MPSPKWLAFALIGATLICCGKKGQPEGTTEDEQLLTTAYFHISDSDGGKAAENAVVILAFEATGIAQLFASDETTMSSCRGTHEQSGAATHVVFKNDQYNVDFTVTLDPAAATVTLPFKVFSGGSGSSTWERRKVSAIMGVNLIFRSAIVGEGLSHADALARVAAYVKAIVARDAKGAPAAGAALLSGTGDDSLSQFTPSSRIVEATIESQGTVTLHYENGITVEVPLYGRLAPEEATPLTMSPLASEPRVHLDLKPPGNAAADPPSRTALLIAPFKNGRGYSWAPEGKVWAFKDNTHYDDVEAKLQGAKYAVTQLADDGATPLAIAQAILADQVPGFILVSTHSSSVSLSTGVLCGTDDTAGNYSPKDTSKLFKTIRESAYADMLTYGGPAPGALAKVFSIVAVNHNMKPKEYSLYLSIRPQFWQWLRSRGADFGRSLFYVDSCATDTTPELREAVRARAFFAFNADVSAALSGAVLDYLVAALLRPTHSAEDAYYNMIRVANTRQMIYKEDKIFYKLISDKSTAEQQRLMDTFNGYGFDADSGTVIRYQDRGWLETPGTDPGAIWLTLMASRASNTADQAAQNLVGCWNDYWVNNDDGSGIGGNFWCANATGGRAPTPAEMSYAYYLLTGEVDPPVTLPLTAPPTVPRFTLHDGDAE